MPPKNPRIVTLDDIRYHAAVGAPTANSGDDGAMVGGGAPSHGVSGWNSAGGKASGDDWYCQPIGQGKGPPSNPLNIQSVPLYEIPGLARSEACRATLRRIHDEFLPIIQRRGYNVTSISEMCCCGDGLDHKPGRRKTCPRMGNNVWGYNQTHTVGRTKSHAIHLRLRKAGASQHHALHSWEDVAGTMAHELSHCVHHNHSKAFFRLMEEILEEHATLQAEALVAGGGGSGWNSGSTEATNATTTTTIPGTSGGHRLGGGGGGNDKGKSRLLETGHRLGGSKNRSNPRRELAARAAEYRKRQMDRIRRRMERSSSREQPCVIEILDDDDETGRDTAAARKRPPPGDRGRKLPPAAKAPKREKGKKPSTANSNPSRNPRARKNPETERPSSRSQPSVIDLTNTGTAIASGTTTVAGARQRRRDLTTARAQESGDAVAAVVDLTSPTPETVASVDKSSRRRKHARGMATDKGLPAWRQAIDLTSPANFDGPVAARAATIGNSNSWACGRCTFRNPPGLLRCEVCGGNQT